jgi:hypothetical protein
MPTQTHSTFASRVRSLSLPVDTHLFDKRQEDMPETTGKHQGSTPDQRYLQFMVIVKLLYYFLCADYFNLCCVF